MEEFIRAVGTKKNHDEESFFNIVDSSPIEGHILPPS